jgi:hypothetical protein
MGSKQVALSARPYQLLSRTSPSRACAATTTMAGSATTMMAGRIGCLG